MARGQEITALNIAMAVIPSLGVAKLAMVAKQATTLGAVARTALYAKSAADGIQGAVSMYQNGREAYTKFSNGDILGGLNSAADALHGAKAAKVGLGSATVMAAGTFSPCQNQKIRPWNVDQSACFAAGTPIRNGDGSKLIEQIVAGDWVLGRDEYDPAAPVKACRVEEVFVREALIWDLKIGGQVIRTTAEHPCFVYNRGWVACQELRVGDRLLTELGTWLAVDGLHDTGLYEKVFNFRVAGEHTYFVGCPEWGFGLWVHNAVYNITVTGKGLSGRERKAIHNHVKRVNAWLATNGPQTVKATAGWLRQQSNNAARREREAAARAGTPYSGQAGHVPDAALSGLAVPPAGWQDMPGRSNNTIGGGWSSRIGQNIDQITINGNVPR